MSSAPGYNATVADPVVGGLVVDAVAALQGTTTDAEVGAYATVPAGGVQCSGSVVTAPQVLSNVATLGGSMYFVSTQAPAGSGLTCNYAPCYYLIGAPWGS